MSQTNAAKVNSVPIPFIVAIHHLSHNPQRNPSSRAYSYSFLSLSLPISPYLSLSLSLLPQILTCWLSRYRENAPWYCRKHAVCGSLILRLHYVASSCSRRHRKNFNLVQSWESQPFRHSFRMCMCDTHSPCVVCHTPENGKHNWLIFITASTCMIHECQSGVGPPNHALHEESESVERPEPAQPNVLSTNNTFCVFQLKKLVPPPEPDKKKSFHNLLHICVF